MSVETATHQALSAICAATFPVIADQDCKTLPRITYHRISGRDEPTYAGDGRGATRVRMQVDVWALTYPAARKLSDQARAAVYVGLNVGQITDNPSDYEPETKLYKASFDVTAWE